MLQVQTSKEDDDIRFKVADIIKLPIRNATTAGKRICKLNYPMGQKIFDYERNLNTFSKPPITML